MRAKAHAFCMIAKHLDAYVTSDTRAVSVALAFCDRWQPRWPRVGWQSLPNLAATNLAWWPPAATVFATDWLPPAVAASPRQPQPPAVAATAPQQQRQLGEANGPLAATSAACVVAGNVCRSSTDHHHACAAAAAAATAAALNKSGCHHGAPAAARARCGNLAEL